MGRYMHTNYHVDTLAGCLRLRLYEKLFPEPVWSFFCGNKDQGMAQCPTLPTENEPTIVQCKIPCTLN